LRRKGIEALAHPRVTGHAFNAIDGLQIACCPLFVKGEQGRCFEGKHGKRRHQRIVPGNLHLVNAVIRDVGEVLVQQAEERIGTEMFASFWHHSRHRNPQHDVIHERHHSHESRIVAFMFTKSQLEGWRDYWDLLTSGNCCYRYTRPIDFEFYKRLRKPIAKSLYTLLEHGWFAAEGKPYAKNYPALCEEFLLTQY